MPTKARLWAVKLHDARNEVCGLPITARLLHLVGDHFELLAPIGYFCLNLHTLGEILTGNITFPLPGASITALRWRTM
jgi:hypothetical protein